MYKIFLCTVIIRRILNVIFNHLLSVILGFIPRIHAEQNLNRHYRVYPDNLDTRVKPEYDNRKRLYTTPENDNLVTQCGRSMIEMLGVLAIVGVLSVGGIAGYSKAMEKFKINKTIQQITKIAANVQTLYIQQDNFNGLDNTTAVQMGVVPDELETSSSGGGTYIYIDNAFGGSVWIDHLWEAYSNYFQIGLTSMTKEACIALATADWNSISSSGVIGVAINDITNVFGVVDYNTLDNCQGVHSDDTTYFACSKSLPIPPAVAAQYCGKQVSGNVFNGFLIIFKK